MTMTDPISDMLTRLRNALMVDHAMVAVPSSKIKVEIARILKEEGYVEDYFVTGEKPQPVLRLRPSNMPATGVAANRSFRV